MKRHGSWYEAVREAGLEVELVLPKGGRWRYGRPAILREEVLQTIRERALDGRPVHARAVRADDPGLVGAGRRLFGSWPEALLCAGVPVDWIPPVSSWRGLLLAVEQLSRRGIRDLRTARQRGFQPLAQEVARVWGSWRRALGESPLALAEVPLRPLLEEIVVPALRGSLPWTLARLRVLADRHGVVTTADLDEEPSPIPAIHRHFESRKSACAAAGVRLNSSRARKVFSREEVLRELARLARDGRRYFGLSWGAAVERFGGPRRARWQPPRRHE